MLHGINCLCSAWRSRWAPWLRLVGPLPLVSPTGSPSQRLRPIPRRCSHFAEQRPIKTRLVMTLQTTFYHATDVYWAPHASIAMSAPWWLTSSPTNILDYPALILHWSFYLPFHYYHVHNSYHCNYSSTTNNTTTAILLWCMWLFGCFAISFMFFVMFFGKLNYHFY